MACIDFLKAVDLCVTHALALAGGVVVHGASFETGGFAVLAVGGSGSGKSTLTAAALRLGARVVSDDLLLVARQSSGQVRVETLRRELYFREPGVSALPQTLRGDLQIFDNAGERRWWLAPEAEPSRFVKSVVPERLWLVSVDRRLGVSRCKAVEQATALAWLIRGISSVLLTVPFDSERVAILDVLGALVSECAASRVRLGRDLIAEPAKTFDRLLVRDGGA